MFINLILWAALITFAVATSLSNHYSKRASSVYTRHSVSTSAPYNHYSTMTSVSSIPHHHNSSIMIGPAIISTIYSSKYKVAYSYIISSTKHPSSKTSESLIRPTGSQINPLPSYSYIGPPSLPTISSSGNMTKLPTISSTKALTTHSRYNTTAIVHTAVTGTIPRSLMSLTASHMASSASRTYIASRVSFVSTLHSVRMKIFPSSHSATSVISSTTAPHVNNLTDGSYSQTALPTKSYHATSCVISGIPCFSSQFPSLITTLPTSNLIFQSNSMLSISTSSIYMLNEYESSVDSPTKTPKDILTVTLGQPRESSAGTDSHIEAASSKFSVPIFLLISDIIMLVMVLI